MFKKIKNSIEAKKEAIKDWWTDSALIDPTNGEVALGSFFTGSGYACWGYILVFGLYCSITKQRLGFVKR